MGQVVRETADQLLQRVEGSEMLLLLGNFVAARLRPVAPELSVGHVSRLINR